MTITVLAERFEDGAWRDWEHLCNEEEIEGVIDTAKAKAFDRMHFGEPLYIDYLKGTEYVFNASFGTPEKPRQGDVRVYAAVVNGMLIGEAVRIERHFLCKHEAA